VLLLGRKLLWCPNAKAGTSSMYDAVLRPAGLFPKGSSRCLPRCNISARVILKEGDVEAREAVRAAPAFTVVRNPWDRLRSCYTERIATRKIRPVPGRKTPLTFAEFVEHVEKHPNQDIHWQAHSSRCRPRAFRYDHVLRLEDGLFEQVVDLFGRYGLPFPGAVTPRKVRGDASGAAARDRALREFYAGAATPAVSVEALVERVGKIYDRDMRSHGYSFPWQAQ
jgi:hypothetical protein